MSYTLNFESKSKYILINVTGDNSLETVGNYLSEVHEICEHYSCRNVLIVENLQGPGLSMLDIYQLISGKTRQAAQVMGRLAYVDINPAHNPESMEFAEDVAVNRGLTVRIFASVPEAEAWLIGQAD